MPPERNVRTWFSANAITLVAILILGLLGGLFQYHQCASAEAICPYCHAVVQAPVSDLATVLSTPSFAKVGSSRVPHPTRCTAVFAFSSLIPRARTTSLHPATSWEACAKCGSHTGQIFGNLIEQTVEMLPNEEVCDVQDGD